ncbi:MAG: pitrilysin family protein [Acidobacteriota bacterium]
MTLSSRFPINTIAASGRRVLLCGLLLMPAGGSADSLRLPEFQKRQLKNGLTLLLMEQHEVPVVSFHVLIKAGSTADPPGKAGLASITVGLLRKGTSHRTADQISAELDFVGGELATAAEPDFSWISSEFLKKDLNEGLSLLSDVLRSPDFPEEEVRKLVARRIDEIKAAKDEALGVIGDYFNAFLYGAHPYGRPVEGDERSLRGLNREDVVAFYKGFYSPGNTVLVACGDFETQAIEEQLKAQLLSWSDRPVTPVEIPLPSRVSGRRLLLIDKPDATQTYFQFGNLGVSRTHPDRTAVQLINTLLGGRFTSLLNTELRINSGLTYGARSTFSLRREAGPFSIFSFTRTETTEKALDLALEVLGRLHFQGVSQEQLDSGREYLKGQFPLSLETSDQLAGLLARLEFYGLEAAEVNGFYRRLNAVTLADARRVIKEHLPLSDLAYVLIGRAESIQKAAVKYALEIKRKAITEEGF